MKGIDHSFRSRRHKVYRVRALLFVELGLFGFVPVPHVALPLGFRHTRPLIFAIVAQLLMA
jgi:hypothetical protein